jgi:hypothetical protein
VPRLNCISKEWFHPDQVTERKEERKAKKKRRGAHRPITNPLVKMAAPVSRGPRGFKGLNKIRVMGEIVKGLPSVVCVRITKPFHEILGFAMVYTFVKDVFNFVFINIIDKNGWWTWWNRVIIGVG